MSTPGALVASDQVDGRGVVRRVGRTDLRRTGHRLRPMVVIGGLVARVVVLACLLAIVWALYTAWSSGGSVSQAGLEAVGARAGVPTATAVTENDGASLLSAPSHREHVVGHGDTLWSLAVSVAPDEDPRPVVHEISTLNGLRSASLTAGEVIMLPVR